VLEADLIGDEEECVLRDHLLAVHPRTIQPATLGVLLRHFVVPERPLPAAYLLTRQARTALLTLDRRLVVVVRAWTSFLGSCCRRSFSAQGLP